MRKIEPNGQFKRDIKREVRTYGLRLAGEVTAIVDSLADDQVLPSRCRDHALRGDYIGYRDCHVRPDLVLIYRKIGADVLQLVRLASHAELGW